MKRKSLYAACATAVVAIVCGAVAYFMSRSVDLIDMIPANSVAVVQVDMARLAENAFDRDEAKDNIARLLNVENLEDCGLDLRGKAYIFETGNGVFGLLVGIADEDATEAWVDRLVESNVCSAVVEKQGVKFTSFNSSVLVGFNGRAMMIVGPLVAAAETENQRKIIKFLEADDEKSIRQTKFYDKLMAANDAIVSLVAQSSALPEKFVAPFVLGAPAHTSVSDICIAASVSIVDGECLVISGETFSFNDGIDKALNAASAAYRKPKGNYLSTISSDDAVVLSCGIEGKAFVKLLRTNPMLRSLLIGLNTTIDINKMLDDVDGDILVRIPFDTSGHIRPVVLADAKGDSWLADVGYWKRSCPQGTSISNGKQPQTFRFSSPDMNVDFGLTNDGKTLFFAPASDDDASVTEAADSRLPANIAAIVGDYNTCVYVNVKSLLEMVGGGVIGKTVAPLMGGISSVIVSIK